ncbi:hypothetical protein BJF78_13990 [Pseudonocardia sp. CNS-139]|nr:hypothetical protein BJF78_13990 [Pseudonocardia sp. CNS-139]
MVTRAHSVRWEKIQMTGVQWRLLVEVGNGATPEEVAPRIGHGVTAATIMCYGLVRSGVLQVERGDAGQPADLPGSVFC